MVKKKFKAIELNKLDEKTIANIRVWRNQLFVREMMYTQNIIAEEEHTNYIKSIKSDPNRGLFVFYLDDEPFGVFQYRRYNQTVPYIETGMYLIKEDYMYLGYGTLMIYFMQFIIFNVLNCRETRGEVMEYNNNALSFNKKMQARLIEVKEITLGDKKYNSYCYSITKEKWNENEYRIKKIVESFVDGFDYRKDIII